MSETPDLFTLHLWDLRAQVESQLRCLTKIHRMYEELPPLGDPQRGIQLRDMHKDLADVITTNAAMRGVSEEALDLLKKLPE